MVDLDPEFRSRTCTALHDLLSASVGCHGVLGSLAASRLVTGLLYGVTPTDPVTYGGVAGILLIAGAAASWARPDAPRTSTRSPRSGTDGTPTADGGRMERRDYILRMIEQLGTVLAALRRRILGGTAEPEAIRGELAETAKLGGLDYDLARAMGPDTLRTMVAPGGEVDPGRCWLLAELFYLDGLEADLAGDAHAARDAFERAGFLYGLLRPLPGNVVGVAEADERLAEIESRLEALGRRRGRLGAGSKG